MGAPDSTTREIQAIGHREFVKPAADGKIVPDPKTGGRWSTACGATNAVAATPAILTPASRWDAAEDVIGLARNRLLEVDGGKLEPRDRRRDDLITRRLGADPATASPWSNSTWADHLLTLFADPELAVYLQRIAGYALLNRGTEDLLVMAHGPRGTGKTVTFNAILRAAGDYGETIDPGAIASTKGYPEHSTNRTGFVGRRIVVSPELEAGARLDTAFVKRLSGGDTLAVRGMRENETRFVFGGVLVIHTNHAPELLTPDDGLKRRMRVFPFKRPRQDPDPDFDKLIDPAHVVAWILDGLRDYLTSGLGAAPAAVVEATAAFHATADRLSEFVSDSLELVNGARTPVPEVYAKYLKWCEAGGIKQPMQKRTLNTRLTEGGFGIGRVRTGGAVFLTRVPTPFVF